MYIYKKRIKFMFLRVLMNGCLHVYCIFLQSHFICNLYKYIQQIV
jgi:ribosomal protein S27E